MAAVGLKRRPRDGVSAHALRHTAVSDMLKGGAHLRDVQAALGHASLSTTQRYCRASSTPPNGDGRSELPESLKVAEQ